MPQEEESHVSPENADAVMQLMENLVVAMERKRNADHRGEGVEHRVIKAGGKVNRLRQRCSIPGCGRMVEALEGFYLHDRTIVCFPCAARIHPPIIE